MGSKARTIKPTTHIWKNPNIRAIQRKRMRAVEVLLIAAAVMAMMMAVYISHCHNRIHISGNRDSGIVVEG